MPQPYLVFLNTLDKQALFVLDKSLPKANYIALDLSSGNHELEAVNTGDSAELGLFIDQYKLKRSAEVCYGGYLEQRTIYQRSPYFKAAKESAKERNIHLGVDLWAKAETSVLGALDGKVHSFKNNLNFGDYGPTIILSHQINDFTFYTLYGHLSIASLENLKTGQLVKQGQSIAKLGTSAVNGDYPPHLHFQVILDLQGNIGDYPGVCSRDEMEFYQSNCPDPSLLLGL
jgi:murein DD-endopeptidase MepM/ murein hydrolase activator NlpD